MTGENTPRIRWRTRMRLHLTPQSLLPRLRSATLDRGSLRPYIRRRTASRLSILFRGKPFIETFLAHTIERSNYDVAVGIGNFESGICIGIYPRLFKPQAFQLTTPIAQLKIGFARNTVVIESMQGKKGKAKEIMEINKEAGEPWPNFLLGEIETHARACGFKTIRIRKPETLYYYKHPATPGFNQPEKVEQLRQRMRNLYYHAAEAKGYQEEKGYFVKKL